MTAGRSIIAAALLVSSLRCISQNSRINLDVRLVLVTVTVTDSHKRFVQGLQKKDFQIWEDKIEQTPVTFSNETTPVTLGIILDKSGSMGGRHQPNGKGVPTLQDQMITTATSCLRRMPGLLHRSREAVSRATRGVVPKRNISECILKESSFGTTPRTISTAVSIVLPS